MTPSHINHIVREIRFKQENKTRKWKLPFVLNRVKKMSIPSKLRRV